MRTHTKKIRIALAGGGTGGHVYPLIAVVEELQKQSIGEYNLEFHYFGGKDPYTSDLQKAGIITHKILTGKLRRYFSFLNILDIPKVFLSFFQCLWKLYWLMPDVVFSKGGTGAFPVVFMAWFYRIPVVIHESDSVPGLNNLLSSRFARRIAIGFSNASRYFNPNKTILVGNPIRPSLLKWKTEQGIAKEKLGFEPSKPLIVVVGGSQGAQQINETIVLCLPDLMPIASILHQTGINNYSDIEKLSKAVLLDLSIEVEKNSRYKLLPYFDEEVDGTALSAADLIISRAGAASISEFSAFGKPAILIPLEGHQTENAYAFSTAGAAKIIEGGNLTPQVLTSLVKVVLENRDVLSGMGQASSRFAHSDSALLVAKEILGSAGYAIS